MHGQIGARTDAYRPKAGTDGFRRLSDGSIDYDSYKTDADRLRLAAIGHGVTAGWRLLGRAVRMSGGWIIAAGTIFRVPPL